MKLINSILMAVLLIGASVVYRMKYDTERAIDQLAQLNKAIKLEQEAIAILEVEWHRLTQPQRLQRLIRKHSSEIKLEVVDPTQIGLIEEIPMRKKEHVTIDRLLESMLKENNNEP